VTSLFGIAVRDVRWAIVAWSIGLGLFGAAMGATFTLFKDQTELDDLFGDEASGFAGGVDSFTSLAGYIDSQILAILPIILGIYAIVAGSRMLAGEEEQGRLDLWLSTPISRTTWALSRLGALFLMIIIVTIGTGIGIVAGLAATGETTDLGLVFLDTLDAIPATLFIAALAFVLSAVFHRRRAASVIATLFLIGSFLLVGIAGLADELDALKWASLFHYYNESKIIADAAADGLYYALALGGAALMVIVGTLRFDQKDLTG
jgi:ABC-2 type transport system permease protein